MKLDIKQLTDRECATIATALEFYCGHIPQAEEETKRKYLELADTFRHAMVLMCTESYKTPVDDVAVLGAQEKGGNAWS